ncbi:MAG: hypothetical protein AAGA33_08680 [Pseudomonadota bacterium]
MAKSQGLRKFFAQAKKTVPIKIGSKLMQFTTTQAVRLGELADRRRDAADGGPAQILDQSRYSLEDAAFRLLQSEDMLLAQAADGKHTLYVGIAGLDGRWMCRSTDGEVLQSNVQSLDRGYLALVKKDAKTLRQHGHCDVSILELVLPPDAAAADIPPAVMTALQAWGEVGKAFRLESPLRVDRSSVVLMAPLAGATN